MTAPATTVNASSRRRGQKRKFALAGLLNIFLTNLILQALLASSILTVAVSTFISQAFNGVLGYTLYGKLVFRGNGLRSATPMLRYSITMAVLWASNTMGILLAQKLGISKNEGALVMVPVLAACSYFLQKKWIFPET